MGHGRNYKISTPGRPRDFDPCPCGALRGVAVEETVAGARRVVVTDGACAKIDILPVAPKAAEDALLREELERRGFSEREDGKLARTEPDDLPVVVSVDVAERKISVDARAERTVEVEARGQSALEAALQQAARRAEDQLVAEIAERLEEVLPGLQREVDAAAAEVAGRALEARARSFGEVESITGSASEGTLEIRVRV